MMIVTGSLTTAIIVIILLYEDSKKVILGACTSCTTCSVELLPLPTPHCLFI